jgi:hypothetical protein
MDVTNEKKTFSVKLTDERRLRQTVLLNQNIVFMVRGLGKMSSTYAIHPSEVWTAKRVIIAMAQLS